MILYCSLIVLWFPGRRSQEIIDAPLGANRGWHMRQHRYRRQSLHSKRPLGAAAGACYSAAAVSQVSGLVSCLLTLYPYP